MLASGLSSISHTRIGPHRTDQNDIWKLVQQEADPMRILEAAVDGWQELDEDMINSIMLVVQMDELLTWKEEMKHQDIDVIIKFLSVACVTSECARCFVIERLHLVRDHGWNGRFTVEQAVKLVTACSVDLLTNEQLHEVLLTFLVLHDAALEDRVRVLCYASMSILEADLPLAIRMRDTMDSLVALLCDGSARVSESVARDIAESGACIAQRLSHTGLIQRDLWSQFLHQYSLLSYLPNILGETCKIPYDMLPFDHKLQ